LSTTGHLPFFRGTWQRWERAGTVPAAISGKAGFPTRRRWPRQRLLLEVYIHRLHDKRLLFNGHLVLPKGL